MTHRRTIVLLSILALLAAYASTLRLMVNLWWNDEDLGHCFVVPFVVLWIVWRERHRWQQVPSQASWWGFPVLLLGAAMHVLALMGIGPFTASLAFLVSVAGTVLALGGPVLARAWAFPLALTLFMLPKLVILYNQLTLPLQLLASRLAAGMLRLLGLAVERHGNVLSVLGHQVEVLEACNGMRYVLALGFVAVVMAYLAGSRPWMRWAMLATAVPAAILGNALRVAAAGYSPALDSGTPHMVAGIVIFLFCLAILAAVSRLLTTARKGSHA